MASKEIYFYKFEASGNDFIVIDHRAKHVKDPAGFAKKICERHTGVGADGVLLFERSRKAAFKMRIINSDGSEAEACGNGFRCIAKFAKEKMGFPSEFRFEALSGLVEARVRAGGVKVRLPDPKDLRAPDEIEVNANRLHYSFLNTGVPHAVIFVQGLLSMEVEGLGRAIRRHERFRPQGTNVNFVEIKGEHDIWVRTYERGVEAETQACGTGSTASALLSWTAGYVRPPVRVKTRGGEILTIDFKTAGKKFRDVWLEGEARLVFEGRVCV